MVPRPRTLLSGPALGVLAALVVFGAHPGEAHSPESVLVVVNAANPDSVRIGEYYARKRSIPDAQVLRLEAMAADPPDGIARQEFNTKIGGPIANWLARNQAQDRILFIVLTKGIPLRINGDGDGSTAASVDSELAVLYLRMTGAHVPTAGPFPNPYFLGDRPLSEARPFTRQEFQLYLVTRLDGFSVDDVLGLVDRGAAPSQVGRFVLDGKSSWTDKGNAWLRASAERLRAAGLNADRVVHDESAAVLTDQVDVLGYYSWGSNDPAIRRRRFNLAFQPGAIGAMFVSSDARTFREPPADWTLPSWSDKHAWFAGSPQSLAGDLISEGITGVAGHVAEPLLGNTIRPDILFPLYLTGFSLAEAYYLAMPSVSWMTVVAGDPLCAPFAPGRQPAAMTHVELDPTTELPRWFSARRVANEASVGVGEDAIRLVIRAQSRLSQGDRDGARALLEQVARRGEVYVKAEELLSGFYELDARFDRAIESYRRILTRDPRHVLALNNLAYALAVRKSAPDEGLPLARKALELAPGNAGVLDTLAWIHHLLGDHRQALPLIEQAANAAPLAAGIRLHAAHVNQALGRTQAARRELARAVELDASLGARPEVAALQRALQ